mmetsp:Transcript_47257/g.106146  ORF Transcript_47257/g.106146 Transcript_47257/m.106146 type:complete len:234 (+) Transcript_47257:476-1177(+)
MTDSTTSGPSKCHDHLLDVMNSSVDPAMTWCRRCMDSDTTTSGAWSLHAKTTGRESMGHSACILSILVMFSKFQDGCAADNFQKFSEAVEIASAYAFLVASRPSAPPVGYMKSGSTARMLSMSLRANMSPSCAMRVLIFQAASVSSKFGAMKRWTFTIIAAESRSLYLQTMGVPGPQLLSTSTNLSGREGSKPSITEDKSDKKVSGSEDFKSSGSSESSQTAKILMPSVAAQR